MARKVEIPPLVNAYLEILAEMGVYGNEVGQVATFMLRKEIMRLIEAGILPSHIPKAFLVPKGKAQEASEGDAEGESEKSSQ